MPAPVCIETPFSREGSKADTGGPLTREFTVLHEPDIDAAVALVEDTAEVTYLGRERKSLAWRSLCYDLWLFTVTYAAAGDDNGGLRPDQMSFRITGATAHITQSFETLGIFGIGPKTLEGTGMTAEATPNIVHPDGHSPGDPDLGRTLVVTGGTGWVPGIYRIVGVNVGDSWVLNYAPAGSGGAGGVWYLPTTADDMQGAIGQDKDSLQGCDIVVPGGEFALSAPRTSFTHADYRAIRSLVGKVTDRDWRGYPAGTLMYLGCDPSGTDGTLQNAQPLKWWNLSHQFRYEPHQVNVVIGDIIVPYVPAFAYAWAKYGLKPATAGLATRPSAVYVERVHRGFFDPNVLGIP